VVQKILAQVKADLNAVMGNRQALQGLSPANFTDERFGLPTVKDILNELEKPGRDPRPEFKTATFDEHVQSMSDLQVGMVLEGVVTNVANFGAFVDIGVHQDGLVHISALASVFVKDPRDVVRTGQMVTVKVVEVDQIRKRIALTMRLDDDVMARQAQRGSEEATGQGRRAGQKPVRRAVEPRPSPAPAGAMADAFAQLKRRG